MTSPTITPTPARADSSGRPRRRAGELAFVLFGASVFGVGLLSVTAYCVTCLYPATVGTFG